MDKQYTCFFTGHRKLPEHRIEYIRRLIKSKVKFLIEEKGVEDFIAGGALGFDTLAAECIVDLKNTYPNIKLHLYLPCFNQSAAWNYDDKYKWHILAAKATDFKYITQGNYYNGCMQKRNRAMVDDAYYGLAYYVMEKSGTGATVRYAEQKGRIVDNIAEMIYGI